MRREYDWHLPEKITRRLGRSSYGRQRSIFEDGHLLIILHTPPETDTHKRETVVFYRSPDGQWMCNGKGDGLGKLTRLIGRYEELWSKLDAKYDQGKSPRELFDLLQAINPLRRAAADMYAALQSAREAVRGDGDIIERRDRAYEIQRQYDLLLEDVKNAHNFRIAQNAEEDAQVSREAVQAQHRLNVLAAIFFPLVTLAGLFGMNLPSGLNDFGIGAFWMIFAAGLILGAFLRGWVMRPCNRDGSPRPDSGWR